MDQRNLNWKWRNIDPSCDLSKTTPFIQSCTSKIDVAPWYLKWIGSIPEPAGVKYGTPNKVLRDDSLHKSVHFLENFQKAQDCFPKKGEGEAKGHLKEIKKNNKQWREIVPDAGMLPSPCFPNFLARTTFVLESLSKVKNPGKDAIFGGFSL